MIGCIILLILALVSMLIGGTIAVIGFCTGTAALEVAGIVIAAIGVLLFFIWALVCAALTPCSVMLTVDCILDWIVKLAWIVVIIAGILGGLPCGFATAVAWGGYAAVQSWLHTIMFRVGCPPIDCTQKRSP
ncbi:MAG: hypothetical protein ACXVUE_22110 [Solirubrobacteraceae bacterium]